MARILIGGFGSRYRRDDHVGALVAVAVAGDLADVGDVELIGPFSDPLDLLGHWDLADLVVLIDATRSGSSPGSLHVIEVRDRPSSTGLSRDEHGVGPTSTHGLGLSDVWRLADAVGQAPRRVVLVGIEGQSFGYGEGLSPAVAHSVPRAVRRVETLINEVLSCA